MRAQKSGMFSRWLVAVILLVCSVSLQAQTVTPNDGEVAGQKLAQELRIQRPGEGDWKGTIRTRTRDRKNTSAIPVFGKVTLGDSTWTNTYLASGFDSKLAEQLTIVHAGAGPNTYWYAVAPKTGASLEQPKKLIGDQGNIPFANSDFWLSDLGFEFYHWPKQIQRASEMKRSRACYVLESINPNPEPDGYSRVVTWVDVETFKQNQGGIIQAEAYDRDNKLYKEFSLGRFKKVNDRWELQDMEITNRKTGTRTKLEFDLGAKAAK